jgi:hypothetical protein
MGQLGSGNGSHYPGQIDTRQLYRNASPAAPDSDTRIDSEMANDTLAAMINVETTLGANPQGHFASVAARLAYYLPDVVLVPNVISFIEQTTVIVPASQHFLGTAQLLWQVWDNNFPQQAIEPNLLTVHPTTWQVVVTFAVAQSGLLLLDAPPTRYQTSFTAVTTVTVPGTVHALGTPYLFWALYDASVPNQAIQPGSLTIHPTTRDVVMSFPTAQSGRVVLTPGRTPYRLTFAATTSLTVTAATHGFQTASLLYQLYDAGVPMALIEPQSVVIDPATFAVTVTFAVAQAGTLLLAPVTPPASATMAAPMATHGTPRRVGPHDPLPTLMRTVQAQETQLQAQASRLEALEEAHRALLASLSPPAQETPS